MTIKRVYHKSSHESHSHGKTVDENGNGESDSDEVGHTQVLIAGDTKLNGKINEKEKQDTYTQDEKKASNKDSNETVGSPVG
jgi:hypothetical protein